MTNMKNQRSYRIHALLLIVMISMIIMMIEIISIANSMFISKIKFKKYPKVQNQVNTPLKKLTSMIRFGPLTRKVLKN